MAAPRAAACSLCLTPSFIPIKTLHLTNAYHATSGGIRTFYRALLPDLIEICDKYLLFYLAALLRREWVAGVQRPTLVGLSCERMDDNVSAYVSPGRLGRALSRAYIRHMYGPPFDAHVANSEYTAGELRRNLWDRSPDFIHVRPMGVDLGAFGPVHRDRQFRRRLMVEAGGTAESVMLLYAGRLSPEKNLGLLVDMLEHLQRPVEPGGVARDYRLVLAGDGPTTEALLRDASRRTRHRVLWVGTIRDRAELAKYYASADVFVHPNPREPFGIGPLEAMASRVPVVLPSAGGVLSYANPANAWLAEPVGESFAHAVRSVVLRPSEARVAAAFETARQLDWSQVASRFFNCTTTCTDAGTRRQGPLPLPFPCD